MGVKKDTPKPLIDVRRDFISSLQRVVDEGNLFLAVVRTALRDGAISGEITKNIIEKRAKAFNKALYGDTDGIE